MPGDCLHDAIMKRFGEKPSFHCGCENRIRQMNAWGPAECREHLEEIVSWLIEQAKTHQWVEVQQDEDGNEVITKRSPPLMARIAKFMAERTKTGELTVAYFCRRMVLGAIKQAEAYDTMEAASAAPAATATTATPKTSTKK